MCIVKIRYCYTMKTLSLLCQIIYPIKDMQPKIDIEEKSGITALTT